MSDQGRRELEQADRLLAFADLLQRDQGDEEEPEELQTWVLFSVASQSYGLPATHVRELIRVGRMTRVPDAPASVRGVTNLRGAILPVVDLAQHLGVGRVEVADGSRIVILEVGPRLIGLLVDEVDRVASLAPSRFATAPPDRLPEAPGSALALYPRESEPSVLLLDAERLIRTEISRHDQAEGTDD